jgi:hypothetical protein
MTQLHELTRLIRSKNAGPFELTIDVMFDSREAYERVLRSGVLSVERMAAIYQVDPALVTAFEAHIALAIKISLPRHVASGSFEDTDVFGGQFHSPIVRLEIP